MPLWLQAPSCSVIQSYVSSERCYLIPGTMEWSVNSVSLLLEVTPHPAIWESCSFQLLTVIPSITLCSQTHSHVHPTRTRCYAISKSPALVYSEFCFCLCICSGKADLPLVQGRRSSQSRWPCRWVYICRWWTHQRTWAPTPLRGRCGCCWNCGRSPHTAPRGTSSLHRQEEGGCRRWEVGTLQGEKCHRT